MFILLQKKNLMLRGKKKFICRDCGEKFSAPDSYDFEDEDIPEVLNMETVEKISFLTKKILGSAVKKNDMSQIHEDMTSMTLCLYETFFMDWKSILAMHYIGRI